MRELIRLIPSQELTDWHRDIDELFNQFIHRPLLEGNIEASLTTWLPTMEAFVKGGRYFVQLDLPGIDPKDVEVSAENNSLIIKGERKKGHEAEEKGYHYSETSYGRFERRFALPKGVDWAR